MTPEQLDDLSFATEQPEPPILTGEARLAWAIILNAFVETSGNVLWKSGAGKDRIQREARDWLLIDNRDMRDCAARAGVDPDWVREVARAALSGEKITRRRLRCLEGEK